MTPLLAARRRMMLKTLTMLATGASGAAHALGTPQGAVVLTVSGKLSNPVGDAHFDMAMLEALPQHSFSARTPWYPQPRKFTGPLLREVLSQAGARGDQVRAIALNDYRVDIPMDDLLRYDVVLARLLDDKPMAVRDKGPLFIVYPFEERPELRSTVYYSRCAWQLRALQVL
jgi:hypothetical protein